MAKKSVVHRQKKREKLVNALWAKRSALIAKRKNKKISQAQRDEANRQLANLPKNSNKIRLRNRCELTGRPRGVYSKFKLSRQKIRELMCLGEIPGLIKSSW